MQRLSRWAVLFAVLLWSVLAAAQQIYPNKPIRFIVPFPPGGTTTPLAHMVGQKLNEAFGQPVIVDNRGGGNTFIGTEALVRSAPDGYTILLCASSHILIPQLLSAPYDPIKDFTPIATIDSNEIVLVINPAVPANTVRELIALAKSRPGELNFASAGSGSVVHLAGELFNITAGVKTQHVPYKGSGPAITDLIGGRVQMYFAVPISAISYINAGKLKAIAVTGEARVPAMRQVPTFAEAGLPGFGLKGWHGVLAPAGTPKPIVDKLSAEIAKMLALADIKEKLLSQGMDPFVSSSEQMAALMKADFAKYTRIIKAASIKIED